MGVVKYSNGIEYVRGSLAKPKIKEGHSHGTYLTGTHREAPTQNSNCTRLYIRNADTYKRTTPPSAKEMAAKTRFKAVAQAVLERAQDLTKMTQDQQDFLAQKNLDGGKRTLKAYLWKVCGDIYDAGH